MDRRVANEQGIHDRKPTESSVSKTNILMYSIAVSRKLPEASCLLKECMIRSH